MNYCNSCGFTDDELFTCDGCGEETCDRHMWRSNSFNLFCGQCKENLINEYELSEESQC